MAIYRCGRIARPLQIEAIILKELNRKSRQGDIPLTATAHKRVKQSIGVQIVPIRPRTTAFSLGLEFFHTKGQQGRWSFPDTLQVVLQQLGTYCAILVKQGIIALFYILLKGLQALVGLLLLCFPSLHAPIVGGAVLSPVVITTLSPSMVIRQRIAVVPSALVLLLLM